MSGDRYRSPLGVFEKVWEYSDCRRKLRLELGAEWSPNNKQGSASNMPQNCSEKSATAGDEL